MLRKGGESGEGGEVGREERMLKKEEKEDWLGVSYGVLSGVASIAASGGESTATFTPVCSLGLYRGSGT